MHPGHVQNGSANPRNREPFGDVTNYLQTGNLDENNSAHNNDKFAASPVSTAAGVVSENYHQAQNLSRNNGETYDPSVSSSNYSSPASGLNLSA